MVRRCFPVTPLGSSEWLYCLAKIAGSSPVWVGSFLHFLAGMFDLVNIADQLSCLLPCFFALVVSPSPIGAMCSVFLF